MKLKSIVGLLALGLIILSVARCEVSQDEDEAEDEENDGIVEDDVEEVVATPREKPHYKRPEVKGNHHFMEPFDSKEEAFRRWVHSQAKKEGVEEDLAKYDGKWLLQEPKDNPIVGDIGLILGSKAKHHAIAADLQKPFTFKDKPLVAQYEVRFQNGIDCGGAYIKLLSKQDRMDLKSFHDKTPYTIMFGPDKCGLDHKLHFIFRHRNPMTGEFEEKHAKKPTANIDSYFSDKKTHLITLVVNPDSNFEFLIDNAIVNQGSLLEDFSPPVNPPKEIEDPEDKKPSDWDEKEKIPDPDATKPDDWDESEPETILDPDAKKPDGWLVDEPLLIPDPAAEKPTDWDDDMDGEWEAPLVDNPKCKEASGCGEWKPPSINNPKYKGKWSPPMIDNTNYKGIWKPRTIPNPNYFEDLTPFKTLATISAVGLELWSMSDGILFDNFLITDDRSVADSYAEQTWVIKSVEERVSSAVGNTLISAIKKATNERPWLWAVFIVVVVLPIVLVIAYCCISKGFWNTIKSAADDRPWLWAVYVVVLLLPVVLLSICLCPKSGPVKPDDLDAQRKKTDEPSPDDDSKDEKESSDSVGPGGDNSAKSKPSKSDLNAEESEEAEAEGEEDEELNGGGDQDKSSSSPKMSPRRRKTRKD